MTSLVGSVLNRVKNTTTRTNKSLIHSKPVFRILSQREEKLACFILTSFLLRGETTATFSRCSDSGGGGGKAKWSANGEIGDTKGSHHAFPPSTPLEQVTKRRLWVHFLERTVLMILKRCDCTSHFVIFSPVQVAPTLDLSKQQDLLHGWG